MGENASKTSSSSGKGKTKKKKSPPRSCAALRGVLVAAGGNLGMVPEDDPSVQGLHRATHGAREQREELGRDTAGTVPCRMTHFPPKRARIHWPDSAACTELGTEEKIAPRFSRRSSFCSSLWHGLPRGASKGARNLCWSLSGGDKP